MSFKQAKVRYILIGVTWILIFFQQKLCSDHYCASAFWEGALGLQKRGKMAMNAILFRSAFPKDIYHDWVNINVEIYANLDWLGLAFHAKFPFWRLHEMMRIGCVTFTKGNPSPADGSGNLSWCKWPGRLFERSGGSNRIPSPNIKGCFFLLEYWVSLSGCSLDAAEFRKMYWQMLKLWKCFLMMMLNMTKF